MKLDDVRRYEAAITRAMPTSTDAVVAAHLAAAAGSLAAAEAAQAGDPDNGTDPDDAAVSTHLTAAKVALDAAQASQAVDGSWDVVPYNTPENLGAGTSPDSAEEYTGDDIRSLQANVGREIVREVAFRSVEGGDGLTIEGYAAVFDDPADIHDQHGDYRETIARGAFAKTISERKPALLFDHGQHPMIGTMPIGQITLIREDAKGLFIRGRLSDNWLVQPVRDALRDGAVRGMSIRADVVQDTWKPNLTDRVVERSVKELALRELGPVVFPAYENTSVSVRSRDVATALTDPDTRAEVARALLNGTAGQSAATPIEPTYNGHSFDYVRRQARRAVADLHKETE